MMFLSTKGKGNREAPRYPIHAPASLVMQNKADQSCIVMIINLCCGGALVQSTIPVEIGDSCGIHIKLPYQQKWFGRDEIEMVMQGIVIRSDSEKGLFAIQFIGDFKLKTSFYHQ
jgi:hypothetical protein